MPIKKIDGITDNQIKQNGVQALADRPNLPNQYGASGLSASQLKAWFDKLATLLVDRINEITGALSSEDAASYIRVAMDKYESLADLIEAFSNGKFASEILKIEFLPGEKASLQALLDGIASKVAENGNELTYQSGKLTEHGEELEQIQAKIGNLEIDKLVDLSSEQTIDGVKYFTGYNHFGRVMELEENTSIVGSDILIRTDDKLSWYRGDYIMFYSADLTTWTQYNNGVISHCYLPPEGGLPITIDLAIPKGESYNRTIATREWVEEQNYVNLAEDNTFTGVNNFKASGASSISQCIVTASTENNGYGYGIYVSPESIVFRRVKGNSSEYPILAFYSDIMHFHRSKTSKIKLKFPTPLVNDEQATFATQEWVEENGGGKLYRHNILFYCLDTTNGNHEVRLEDISKKSTAYTSVVEFANEFTENYYGVVSYNGGFGNGACQLVIGNPNSSSLQFTVQGAVFSMGNIKGAYISFNEEQIASQITIIDTVTEI